MNKTGHFPTVPWPFISQGITVFRRRNDSWERLGSSESVVAPYVTPVINSILGYQFETAAQRESSFIGATRIATSGTPTPIPPPVLQDWSTVKENNKPFLKRVSNDEIIVSNYQIGANTYTFSNGGVKTSLGKEYVSAIDIHTAYYVHGLYSVFNIFDYKNCLLVDTNTAIHGAFGLTRQPLSIDDSRTVYDNGFTPFHKDYFINQLEVSSNLVTKVTSDANIGTVDILTALAELPETLGSILSACKTMLKLYTDCKKGELRLQNRAKQIRMSYDEAVRSLGAMSEAVLDGPGSKRFKRQRIRMIAKQRKQLKQQLKLNLEEVADAITSVWLTYRYNITPNVLLIEGALEAVNKSESKFARWASTLESTLQPPTGYSGDISVTHRCQIKRMFSQLSVLNHLSSNPFLTAWELVPLSFTIDWFINVGDAISALTFTPGNFAQEGATYSWKVSGTIFKTYPDGSKTTVKVQGYKRIVIDPSTYCRLSWNPDLSPIRQLDALALTWKLTLKRFLKLKD